MDRGRVRNPGGVAGAPAPRKKPRTVLYQGWLDDPDFRPIVDQDLTDGQHRNPDWVGRPEFFYRLLPHRDGLTQEIAQAGFTAVAVYGVEGPGLAPAPGMGRSAAA